MITLVLKFFWVMLLLYIPFFILIPKFKENTQKGLDKFYMAIGGMVIAIDLIAALYLYPRITILMQEANVISAYGIKNIIYFVISFVLGSVLVLLGWKKIKIPLKNKAFYLWWILMVLLVYISTELIIASTVSSIMKIPSNF